MKRLELLSPAKDLSCGKIAINHGADALYIGAPKFGARQAVGNSLADLQTLTDYAHLYGAKVYVTVNTVLFDHELEEVRKLIYNLYDIGTDALIVQDFGILKMDLPPIALHASTQCHNNSLEQIHFLEQLGFKRAILARELDLLQIANIRQNSAIALEAFVHGALCVCYSGQCYMSKFVTGRSGNRGECAQVCRNRYDLVDANGQILARQKHLLSLRDMNRAEALQEMIAAGITSFKVEGRLKDENYVKNVIAHYRHTLDNIMANDGKYRPSSSGKTTFFFTPDVSRTFNRGYTDYYLHGERHKIASWDTPKAMGEKIGTLRQDDKHRLFYDGTLEIVNGDGLCFLNADDELEGFFVNGVSGNRIIPHKPLSDFRKVTLYRNVDKAFEKVLSGKTAERKIAVDMLFEATDKGFALHVKDEDGFEAVAELQTEKEPAKNPEMVGQQLKRSLSKLGNTPFIARNVEVGTSAYFLPQSVVNTLRSQAVESLMKRRVQVFKPQPQELHYNPEPLFETVTYKKNVTNCLSEAVYRDFGAKTIEEGIDKSLDFKDKELMVCKYCIRYELGICSKKNPHAKVALPLFLDDGRHRFRLQFDCSQCVMKILPCKE